MATWAQGGNGGHVGVGALGLGCIGTGRGGVGARVVGTEGCVGAFPRAPRLQEFPHRALAGQLFRMARKASGSAAGRSGARAAVQRGKPAAKGTKRPEVQKSKVQKSRVQKSRVQRPEVLEAASSSPAVQTSKHKFCTFDKRRNRWLVQRRNAPFGGIAKDGEEAVRRPVVHLSGAVRTCQPRVRFPTCLESRV